MLVGHEPKNVLTVCKDSVLTWVLGLLHPNNTRLGFFLSFFYYSHIFGDGADTVAELVRLNHHPPLLLLELGNVPDCVLVHGDDAHSVIRLTSRWYQSVDCYNTREQNRSIPRKC